MIFSQPEKVMMYRIVTSGLGANNNFRRIYFYGQLETFDDSAFGSYPFYSLGIAIFVGFPSLTQPTLIGIFYFGEGID